MIQEICAYLVTFVQLKIKWFSDYIISSLDHLSIIITTIALCKRLKWTQSAFYGVKILMGHCPCFTCEISVNLYKTVNKDCILS